MFFYLPGKDRASYATILVAVNFATNNTHDDWRQWRLPCRSVYNFNPQSAMTLHHLGFDAANCFAIGCQRLTSEATNFVNSSGESSLTSIPSCASRFWTAGN